MSKQSYVGYFCGAVWVSEATRPCNKSKNSERNNQPGLPAVYNHKMFPIVDKSTFTQWDNFAAPI
jgi:hypothetical protein